MDGLIQYIVTTLGNQENSLIATFNKRTEDLEQRVTTIETQAIAEHSYLEKQLEGASTNLDRLFGGINEIDECTHIEFKTLATF